MGKSLRVLIIDDSKDDTLLVLRELKNSGYDPIFERVDTAQDLIDALKKQPWDIVISDYVMPQFDGLSALELVQKTGRDLPFIIVSGKIGEDTAVKAMKNGAYDYIMKTNLTRLGPAIERGLNEACIRRERKLAIEQARTLSSRLLEVQEEERRNIARELHDQIGQSLTALKLMLTKAMRTTGSDTGPVLNEAQSVVSELIQQVREMALKLRPSMLDDIGLLPTLDWHFQRYTAQTQVKVHFRHNCQEENFRPDINTAVYRIVQEALTNVARHARVKEVNVVIQASPKSVYLKIEDHGCGFEWSRIAKKACIGLSGMRERAELSGGKLTISTSPGNGTCITAEIPTTPITDEETEEESVSGIAL